MKIIVIARTRNEEKNIADFCNCYSWADKIIVSDGGSDDRTKEIASQFHNVEVYNFHPKVTKDDWITWRNPHGLHINSMIAQATARNADWIIFDDVDCFPTLELQRDLRDILESTDKNCVFLNRVYMFGDNQWFRDATLPGGKKATWASSTSLYAWKPGIVRASEEDAWVHEMNIHNADVLHLSPPHSVIHDFYPVSGSRQHKVDYYHASGEQIGCLNPLSYYKDIQPMEEWMRWK